MAYLVDFVKTDIVCRNPNVNNHICLDDHSMANTHSASNSTSDMIRLIKNLCSYIGHELTIGLPG